MNSFIEKCIKEVTDELKGILPFKNIQWDICDSTSYYGKYKHSTNTIYISKYLTNEIDIRNTVAHELIHACGIHNHGSAFKAYANNLKQYGFDVLGEIRDMDAMHEAHEKKKKYLIKCTHCSFETKRIHKVKVSKYVCARCKNKLTIERI